MPPDPSNLTDAQLHRIIQACGDFQQALSALSFLTEECDYADSYPLAKMRKFRCYESAAIVAFARPFEVARGRLALGLRAVGVQLSPGEEEIKKKVIELRQKVVAHSDDERMHFKMSTTQPFSDSPASFPILMFDESLRLNEEEVDSFRSLLHKLIFSLAKTLYDLAQEQPERLNFYKLPAV